MAGEGLEEDNHEKCYIRRENLENNAEEKSKLKKRNVRKGRYGIREND